MAARLIAAGVPLAAVKVAQGGFDTHANQGRSHARVLEELAAFRAALVRAGAWHRRRARSGAIAPCPAWLERPRAAEKLPRIVPLRRP